MFELIDFIIVRPIANILFAIYSVVGDFGLAIILFTILVKLCTWPLTKSQLHQTKLMRKIQPELAKIKKQCNGNRQLESLQTMDLYKRNNVKPFRSILTIVIQLPIFIALYTAIRVMVMPTPTDNLQTRAYGIVQQLPQINSVIETQQNYLADTANNTYDFHPKLFGIVDLDRTAFPLDSPAAATTLAIAVLAAILQYIVTKQQMPSKKSKNSKTFRQIMKEASEGKEPDQTELNNAMTGSMAVMMPAMMFLIMINLPGALVFYYLLITLINGIQQKFIFNKDEKEMDAIADKAILKELKDVKKIKEAEVVENKKTGTKITRISAKEAKRRKS